MNTERKTTADVCAELGITSTAKFNGKTKRDNWECFAWEVTLSYKGRTLAVPYFCGMAHIVKSSNRFLADKPKPPETADVVSSLVLDSSASDSTFADWCAEFGYEEDSRKALETYLACQKSGLDLRNLLRDGAALEALRNSEW